MDDVAKIHYALSKLTGLTKTWKDSFPAEKCNWAIWKGLLQEAFSCEESELKKRKEVQHYRRRPGKDITEYFYQKLAKCNKAQILKRESIESIVDRLNSSRIRDCLGASSRYLTPTELLPGRHDYLELILLFALTRRVDDALTCVPCLSLGQSNPTTFAGLEFLLLLRTLGLDVLRNLLSALLLLRLCYDKKRCVYLLKF